MRPWSLLRAAAGALVLLSCSAAWADPPGRVGRIAELHGTMWLYDTEQGEWVAAEHNRPLTSGDRLATDRDARTELRIGSTTVRLGPDTEVLLERVDDERMQLQLEHGSLAARVRNRESAREFEVDTQEGRFLPQQPGHFWIERNGDASAAAAWSGELRFDASDSTLLVPQGQRADFWREAGVTHYTWAAAPQDRFTEWALSDDRRDEQLAASRHVSPEMTGYEDLDRYGRWDSHPEYGVVWVPQQVAPGWAPYRYGHWAWVRPWGWTWVDDARWGFAPFHYGRWLWWGNRWAWVPGTYVARPVYAPALVGWVGGSNVSVSINIGSGPVVGWVPLAPREVYYPPYTVGREHWRHVNPYVPHDRFYRPGQPPQGPVMYTNRGVPGGVTVVPTDTMKRRQPVASVANTIEPRIARQLVEHKAPPQMPPPPPAERVPSASLNPVRPPPTVAQPVRPSPGAVHPVPQAPTMASPPPSAAPVPQASLPRPAPGAVAVQPAAPVAAPRPAPPPAMVAPVTPPSVARPAEPAAVSPVPQAPPRPTARIPRDDEGRPVPSRHGGATAGVPEPAAPVARPAPPVVSVPAAPPAHPPAPVQRPTPPAPQPAPQPATPPAPAPAPAVAPHPPNRDEADGRRQQRPRDPREQQDREGQDRAKPGNPRTQVQ